MAHQQVKNAANAAPETKTAGDELKASTQIEERLAAALGQPGDARIIASARDKFLTAKGFIDHGTHVEIPPTANAQMTKIIEGYLDLKSLSAGLRAQYATLMHTVLTDKMLEQYFTATTPEGGLEGALSNLSKQDMDSLYRQARELQSGREAVAAGIRPDRKSS